MGKHIGTPLAVGHNDPPFNELLSPHLHLLNTIGMQDKVVPDGFMIGEMLHTGEEARWGTLLTGQLSKYVCLTLHEQTFSMGERIDRSACGIEDGCDRCTSLGGWIIANRQGKN